MCAPRQMVYAWREAETCFVALSQACAPWRDDGGGGGADIYMSRVSTYAIQLL